MELKAKGILGDGTKEASMAHKALDAVLNKETKNKQNLLALQDQEPGEAGEDEEPGQKSPKGKDGQVVEADLLSEMGPKAEKMEASVRINRMVKLLKQVKKDVGSSKAAALDQPLAALQKLEKQGKKVKLDQAKGKLFDAALAVKKAKSG